ncbi:MAG: 2-isopropylmalate synthase [Magnetococcales bacterium]|nr:2-isopropylmalate synthase [Magnetococcales bacterium]
MECSAAVKYRPAPAVPLTLRKWPEQVITRAPQWCAVDLRDGNQALPSPLEPTIKRQFFQRLVALGFRQIEISFPAASQPEFDFTRSLIEEHLVPPGVTLQVLTQARDAIIDRTFEALHGTESAIVHLYLSTSPAQRRLVFGKSREEMIAMARQGAERVGRQAESRPETAWTFEFSPESFSNTEPEFALAIAEAVCDVWKPGPDRPVILNLPATVESASPNHYADQVEWFCRRFSRRGEVTISVHPHNDRGTAVAAAELALLAGADRVEGTLFGNGERTGNVDLITLALNLRSQGIDPGLDFSRLDELAECYQSWCGLPVHPRHPYAGELVYTAFSGSHQDAIRKGMAAQRPDQPWQVPYLPLDPADVGRDYAAVVRINSQSGKGGAAFRLERERGFAPPAGLMREFAQAVQRHSEAVGGELPPGAVGDLFSRLYFHPPGPFALNGFHLLEGPEGVILRADLTRQGEPWSVEGRGNGPIDAFLDALSLPWRVSGFEERAIESGNDARAAAFVRLERDGNPCAACWGAGVGESIVAASLRAVTAALNRGNFVTDS